MPLRITMVLVTLTTALFSQAGTGENLPPMTGLPAGIRSRFVDNHNGLRMHLLEAGFETGGRPCVLLLHGFPELAYSWRKVMPALAAAGYQVVAPDQRGHGRTTGSDTTYAGDLAPYRPLNLVRDVVGLVTALGHRSVHVVGHDAGSGVAAWGALVRPDMFQSLVMMTSPFAGPPAGRRPAERAAGNSIVAINPELAKLPRPRKHYQWYYTTPEANANMQHAAQGLSAFLRGYYHQKSGDWPGNHPVPLQGWTPAELARMPTYYIMDLEQGMAETVAAEMPTRSEIAACRWLPDDELNVYASEYQRTGFQGGLQWYRARLSGKFDAELERYSGRTIDVPSFYVAGRADWGTYQFPGAFEKMQSSACSRMWGVHFIAGAGHWVQQERPAEVTALLLEFLRAAQRQNENR